MNSEKDYIEINRTAWNNKTDIHVRSEFYDLPSFLNGRSSLNPIELNLLGDVKGKSVLHLQCHFGQDSISLSRMAAQVTGIDLSDKAIDKARSLANELNTDTEFICCNIYDLPKHLNKTFDIVFTSYGTIGWLPDLQKWADVITHFLKPGGKFIFVEFHPVVWMFDDHFRSINYNYFNTGVIHETYTGSYADQKADLVQEYMMWNHSLSEIFSSLIQNKLVIDQFQEYDYSPYNCFKETLEVAPNRFRIKHLDNKIPMVFSLVATKALS
ncbi:MAG: class I SAM-dependent methyltransferase [Sphingobacteriaceae bacterium]